MLGFVLGQKNSAYIPGPGTVGREPFLRTPKQPLAFITYDLPT